MSAEPFKGIPPYWGLWTAPASSKPGVTAAPVIIEAMLSLLLTQPCTFQIFLQARLMLTVLLSWASLAAGEPGSTPCSWGREHPRSPNFMVKEGGQDKG